MTTTGDRTKPRSVGTRRFIASLAAGDGDRIALARIVMIGSAATSDRQDVVIARDILVAAIDALRARGVTATILVTPAGFVDHKPGGAWSGTSGWGTEQADFDRLAAVAEDVMRELMAPDVIALASGTVAHILIGVDVWPTPHREPHAEIACHVDVESGEIVAVTGKSYPNTQQQDGLIRDPDVGSHVITVGNERVAVLVCHDLAAWSPRGNAVAKGVRQKAWQAMQDAVETGRPTLAVQLPHTVSAAATWRPAWSRFVERSGGSLRSGTSAIRHLDRWWQPIETPPDDKLLARTGVGTPALDILVTEEPG